jgi:hypothetical protein
MTQVHQGTMQGGGVWILVEFFKKWVKTHFMGDQKEHFINPFESPYPLYFECVLSLMNQFNFWIFQMMLKLTYFFIFKFWSSF